MLPVLWRVREERAEPLNAAVGGLTINVRKMLAEMDQQLFEECQKKWEEEESKAEEVEANREQYWRKVEELLRSTLDMSLRAP